MEKGLKNKIALVTGASRGIGKQVALKLSQEKSTVLINSRNKIELDKTAKYISDFSGNDVYTFPADLTDPNQIKILMNNIISQFGSLDILVNCSANSTFGEYLELSDSDWKLIFETKFFAYVRCMREAIPHMIKNRFGRIVNISGMAGIEPSSPVELANASVNAAVNTVSKGLARVMGKYNIRINVVSPSHTSTDRFIKILETNAQKMKISSETLIKEFESEVPINRLARPEEIANTIIFLLSEDSSFINGACLRVDGGMSRSV